MPASRRPCKGLAVEAAAGMGSEHLTSSAWPGPSKLEARAATSPCVLLAPPTCAPAASLPQLSPSFWRAACLRGRSSTYGLGAAGRRRSAPLRPPAVWPAPHSRCRSSPAWQPGTRRCGQLEDGKGRQSKVQAGKCRCEGQLAWPQPPVQLAVIHRSRHPNIKAVSTAAPLAPRISSASQWRPFSRLAAPHL